ncbi:MAG: ATP-binding protein [Saprospiraceae bacterium]
MNFDAVDKVENLLAKHLPEIDQSLLSMLPDLISDSERESIIKTNKKKDHQSFVPAAGLCLLKKPIGSRGILTELEEMEYRRRCSYPVQILLGIKKNNPIEQRLEVDHVPAMLSQTQSAIVKDALKYPLRLVIGPPGTGKSFTIAALAAEMMALGKSVLIASKNMEAAEVVANKIEHDLGLEEIVVRASKKGFRKAAQERLENISLGLNSKLIFWKDIKKIRADLTRINQRITTVEKLIELQQSKFQADGEFLYEFSGGFIEKLKRKWLEYQHNKKEPIWDLFSELESLISKRNKVSKKYILDYFSYFLDMTFRTSRDDLRIMSRALRARTGNKKSDYFGETDFKSILKALPIWTVCVADVHKILPLYSELFDLVIIDEATQCDMASCLPILERGKAALVVGDPKQLRHLSFLSYKQQEIFAKQFNITQEDKEELNYRDNSLLDLVNAKITLQNCVYFLNEHYRSMPDIISFSNKHFYANSLHVMTKNIATENRQHNFIEQINGKRTLRGYNAKEAEYIIDEIIGLIEYEKNLEPHLCQSIGVVSPFRDQVNYLQRKVENHLDANQLERHKVMVGTPFSFQGEERDFMYISFTLDENSHPSAFQYLNKADVFNVCITRARTKQINCISFKFNELKNSSLLGQYLSFIKAQNNSIESNYSDHIEDPFLEEVKKIINDFGVDEIIIGYEIAGVKIDLLIVNNGNNFGIDLAGYPGEYEETLCLATWKMIYRTGLPIFYVPYSDWVFDKERVVNALKKFISA